MAGQCSGNITVSTPSPVCTGFIGDVNGDGVVSIVDALFIAQATVGTRTLNDCQLRKADVDGNGYVSIVDALFIAQYTVLTPVPPGTLAAIARARLVTPTPVDMTKPVPILSSAPAGTDPNNPATWGQ